MAPRGSKRKAGLKREDAARDRMRDMGFKERVINESIKELLRVYGEDHWFLIEDGSYDPLLNICLEKQEEEMAEDQNEVIAEEEQTNQLAEEEEEEAYQLAENQEEEKDQKLFDWFLKRNEIMGMIHLLVLQESIASEAVMDPSPPAFQFGDASDGYAPHSVEGAEYTSCGWLEDEDGDNDGDNDNDNDGDVDDDVDEIIHRIPEPLCEELEELLREVRGQKKGKKSSSK